MTDIPEQRSVNLDENNLKIAKQQLGITSQLLSLYFAAVPSGSAAISPAYILIS